MISLNDSNNIDIVAHSIFVQGWLDIEDDTYFGRPVDLEFMVDGSMLITDDTENMVYRIYYNNTKDVGVATTQESSENECDFSYADDGQGVNNNDGGTV